MANLRKPFLMYLWSSWTRWLPLIMDVALHFSSKIGRMSWSKKLEIFVVIARIECSMGRTGIPSYELRIEYHCHLQANKEALLLTLWVLGLKYRWDSSDFSGSGNISLICHCRINFFEAKVIRPWVILLKISWNGFSDSWTKALVFVRYFCTFCSKFPTDPI